MEFKLDTSGDVGGKSWSDLSPFAQGYTAPILEAVGAPFSDLAPETLARIIADCEYVVGVERGHDRHVSRCADEGASLWRKRQSPLAGGQPEPAYGLPPLTVQLGDDGKVRFQ